MWLWLISAIAGSILGSASDSWFADTKAGIWFYKKVDQVSGWVARKLNIQILAEEESWKKKHPNVAKKISDLENKVKYLEKIHLNDGK